MKRIYQIMFVIAFIAFAVPMYAVAIDSVGSNLTGEILSGLFNYYSPSLSDTLRSEILKVVELGALLLVYFQAQLKADPNKQAISGVIGWLLNAATFFVKNTSADQAQSAPTEDVKKK